MPKFNTGNPVGSSDPRDLYDTAAVADNLVTGTEQTYPDRLGRSRRSWQSVEDQVNQQADQYADDKEYRDSTFASDQTYRANAFQAAQDDREGVFNAYLVSAGYVGTGTDGAVENYAAGIEITQYNQVVRDTSGEFWRVSGSTALPYTTTGAGLPEGGAFVAVGDAALRQELTLPVSGGNGALHINGALLKVDNEAELAGLAPSDIFDGQCAVISDTLRIFKWSSSDNEWIGLSNYEEDGDGRDFVDLVNAKTAPSRLFVKSSATPALILSTVQGDMDTAESYHTQYRLYEDADGFLRMQWLRVASNKAAQSDNYSLNTSTDISGSWNTATGNSPYATSEGATFEVVPVLGTDVYMRAYTDDRGGMWDIYIYGEDGRIVENVKVSVWDAVGESKEILLASGLPRGYYSVKGVFLGDDPFNLPSTGAGTSRGWISTGSFWSVQAIDTTTRADDTSPVVTLAASGVQEFAISARPASESVVERWVPVHSGVTGVMQSLEVLTQVYGGRSSAPLSSDWKNLPDYNFECDKVTITQKYSARNPNAPTIEMWSGRIVYTLTPNGMEIDHKITFSVDTYVGSGYIYQFGSDSSLSSKIETTGLADPFSYDVISDGSSHDTWPRGSFIRPSAEIDAGVPTVFAMSVDSALKSVNHLKPYAEDLSKAALFTDRADGVSKWYHRACKDGSIIPAGEVWEVKSRMTAGAIL